MPTVCFKVSKSESVSGIEAEPPTFRFLSLVRTGRPTRVTQVKSVGITQSNKKYVLSNSESVPCNFFIFDHVTFIQFKICCCVQNFIEIGR